MHEDRLALVVDLCGVFVRHPRVVESLAVWIWSIYLVICCEQLVDVVEECVHVHLSEVRSAIYISDLHVASWAVCYASSTSVVGDLSTITNWNRIAAIRS